MMLRRSIIAASLAVLLGLLGLASAHAEPSRSDAYERLLREAAVALLKDGNTRFTQGQMQHPNQDVARRENISNEGQEPFATILTCSDSRVPLELIFDRGLGDLFVVRVAGNVAGESELASLEYGVGHLATPLLLVLGHSKCGAVSAVANGAELEGHLHNLIGRIEPAVAKVRAQNVATNDFIPRVIEANVFHTISEVLRHSDVIRAAVVSQKLQVIGAVYDLQTGNVSWLGTHPEQETILKATQAGAAKEIAAQQPPEEVQPEPTPEPTPKAPRRRPISNAYLVPAAESHH